MSDKGSARYGTRDWVAQRATGALLGLYVLLVIGRAALLPDFGHGVLRTLLAPVWMKAFSSVAVLALGWHSWIGMRDVWMDYIKPYGIRLVLHVATIVWLLAAMAIALRAFWRA